MKGLCSQWSKVKCTCMTKIYYTLVKFQSKTAGESDSEREDMELSEISKVLEKHDPSFSRFVPEHNYFVCVCLHVSRPVLPL